MDLNDIKLRFLLNIRFEFILKNILALLNKIFITLL